MKIEEIETLLDEADDTDFSERERIIMALRAIGYALCEQLKCEKEEAKKP
jgi:hypothetical protein